MAPSRIAGWTAVALVVAAVLAYAAITLLGGITTLLDIISTALKEG